MPRLIVRRKKPNPVPRCGRRIEYVSPHSPFQKMIEAQRLKLGMSVRDVAEAVNEITGAPKLNSGSLWIWLRNKNGFPHPKSATPRRLKALARVLRFPLPLLEEALDSSRHLFTAREKAEPPQSVRALEQLIQILKNDKRSYISRVRILSMAESLLAGSRSR